MSTINNYINQYNKMGDIEHRERISLKTMQMKLFSVIR